MPHCHHNTDWKSFLAYLNHVIFGLHPLKVWNRTELIYSQDSTQGVEIGKFFAHHLELGERDIAAAQRCIVSNMCITFNAWKTVIQKGQLVGILKLNCRIGGLPMKQTWMYNIMARIRRLQSPAGKATSLLSSGKASVLGINAQILSSPVHHLNANKCAWQVLAVTNKASQINWTSVYIYIYT